VEDYGLAPIEAMGSGRPVIARRAGGVLDTVREGLSGLFFDAPDPAALAAAVERADALPWEPAAIRAHAEQFGQDAFELRLIGFLRQALAQAGGRRGRAR
jgi:glycosyltransferase involved in cell wall biosynthesis